MHGMELSIEPGEGLNIYADQKRKGGADRGRCVLVYVGPDDRLSVTISIGDEGDDDVDVEILDGAAKLVKFPGYVPHWKSSGSPVKAHELGDVIWIEGEAYIIRREKDGTGPFLMNPPPGE